jgi:hypothetical protein
MKTNIITKGWEVLNLMKRTDKYSESSIELAEHSNPETTKTAQGRNHNIPLNINSGY